MTWYGMDTTSFALAGLDFKGYKAILQEITALGFNSIRIPLSDELVKDSSKIEIATKWLRAQNPRDVPPHLHPLQLLDRVVDTAQSLHLMIILDNHFSKARAATHVASDVVKRVLGVRPDSETTWATDGYTEKQSIADWVTLTKRYKNYGSLSVSISGDEPHTDHTGDTWTLKDYLTRGATWGPCRPSVVGKARQLVGKEQRLGEGGRGCGRCDSKGEPARASLRRGSAALSQSERQVRR